MVLPFGIEVIVTGVLSEVTASNNGAGISVKGFSIGPKGNSSRVMLRNVIASSNSGAGLEAGNVSTLRVAHSVTGNGTGVSRSPDGTIQSYGDNDIDGNTNNNFGALTPLAMH